MSYNNIITRFNGMPNIQQFIEDRSYDINMDTFTRFWNKLNKKLPILIDDNLIEWIGYNSSNVYDSKRDMLKLLDSYNIPYEKYNYSNFIEYIDNNQNLELVKPERNKSTVQKNYIIMTIKNFKRAMMMVNTERGKQVREYYINLEELLYDYMELQCYYKQTQLCIKDEKIDKLILKLEKIEKQNNELLEQNDELLDNIETIDKKLGVTIVERSVRTRNTKQWHKLIIVYVKNSEDKILKKYDYYAIRSQRLSANRDYRKRFNNLPKVYETESYEGNAINLYNRIKDNFKDSAIFTNNFIKLNEDTNRDTFEFQLNSFCNEVKNEFSD